MNLMQLNATHIEQLNALRQLTYARDYEMGRGFSNVKEVNNGLVGFTDNAQLYRLERYKHNTFTIYRLITIGIHQLNDMRVHVVEDGASLEIHKIEDKTDKCDNFLKPILLQIIWDGLNLHKKLLSLPNISPADYELYKPAIGFFSFYRAEINNALNKVFPTYSLILDEKVLIASEGFVTSIPFVLRHKYTHLYSLYKALEVNSRERDNIRFDGIGICNNRVVWYEAEALEQGGIMYSVNERSHPGVVLINVLKSREQMSIGPAFSIKARTPNALYLRDLLLRLVWAKIDRISSVVMDKPKKYRHFEKMLSEFGFKESENNKVLLTVK